MALVKVNKKIPFIPRRGIEFFRNNPDLWYKLKSGETCEVPDKIVNKFSDNFIKVTKEKMKAKDKGLYPKDAFMKNSSKK